MSGEGNYSCCFTSWHEYLSPAATCLLQSPEGDLRLSKGRVVGTLGQMLSSDKRPSFFLPFSTSSSSFPSIPFFPSFPLFFFPPFPLQVHRIELIISCLWPMLGLSFVLFHFIIFPFYSLSLLLFLSSSWASVLEYLIHVLPSYLNIVCPWKIFCIILKHACFQFKSTGNDFHCFFFSHHTK